MKRTIAARILAVRAKRNRVSGILKALSLACAALMALPGCTPKAEKAATVRLVLPDFNAPSDVSQKKSVSAQAISTKKIIDRVMINVTGPGMERPVVLIWEPRRTATGREAPPESFPLEITKGSERLIQVLVAVTEVADDGNGDDNGEFALFYGDATKPIVNSVEPVTIRLSALTSATHGNGRIIGRYFDSNGAMLTGRVQMFFHPPLDRPPMIIDTAEMFGGWFDVFALPTSNTLITARLEEHGDIFSKTYLGDSSLISGAGAMRLKASRGAAYRDTHDRTTGQVIGRSTSGPRTVVAGFFGPGLGSTPRKVKYYNGSTEFERLYTSADVGDGTKLIWDGGTVVGGHGYETPGMGTCNGVGETLGENCLSFDHEELTHGDGGLGVLGPFVSNSSGGGFIGANYNPASQSLVVNWTMAAGTTGPNDVPVVTVYSRILDSNQSHDFHDRDVNCESLSEHGFVRKGDVETSSGVNAYSHSISGITESNWNDGRVEIVLCPRDKEGKAFRTVASHRFYGSGENQIPHKELVLSSSTQNVSTGTGCLPVTVTHREAGVETAVASDLDVYISANGPNSGGAFFSDNLCTESAWMTTIPDGESSQVIYFYASNAGFYDLNASASGVFGPSLKIAAVYPSTPTKARVESLGAAHFIKGHCHSLSVVLYGPSDILGNNANQTLTLIDSSSTPGTFHSDEACSTVARTTVSFTSTEAYAKVYFKPGATTGAFSLSATGGPSPEPLSYTLAENAVTGLTFHRVAVGGSKYYAANECFGARVHPAASNGAPLRLLSDSTVSLSSGIGALKFSLDPSCANAASTLSVPIKANSSDGSSNEFYVKVNSAVSMETVTMALANPSLTLTHTMELQPDAIQLTSSPLNNQFMSGFCHQLDFAVTRMGAVIGALPDSLSVLFNTYSLELYDSPSCTSTLSSNRVTLPSGAGSTFTIWAKSYGSGVSLSANLEGVPAMVDLNYSAAHQYFMFSIQLNNGAPAGGDSCVEVKARLKDGGVPVLASVPVNLGVTYMGDGPTANSEFYLDPSCITSSGMNSVTYSIPPGQSDSMESYYLKTAPAPFSSFSLNFNFSAPQFAPMPNSSESLPCDSTSCTSF